MRASRSARLSDNRAHRTVVLYQHTIAAGQATFSKTAAAMVRVNHCITFWKQITARSHLRISTCILSPFCLYLNTRQAKAAATSTRKMFIGRLLQAREIESDETAVSSSSSSSSSPPASDTRFFDAGRGPFNRAWLQGVVAEVLNPQLFLLDDGTGRISIRSRAAVAVGSFLSLRPWPRCSPLFVSDCAIPATV